MLVLHLHEFWLMGEMARFVCLKAQLWRDFVVVRIFCAMSERGSEELFSVVRYWNALIDRIKKFVRYE